MKNLIVFITFFIGTSVVAFSQDKVPMVDSKGHIYYDNKQIGSMKTGEGFDKGGHSVTKIDNNGNVVDSTGKAIGRLTKGQTFEYYVNDKAEQFSISKPNHNGICYVKDSNGKTIMLLHNNYKQQAACAMHCAKENHCLMPSMSDNETKVITKTVEKSTVSIQSILTPYLQIKNALAKDNSGDAAIAGVTLESALKMFDKSILTADQIKIFEDVEEDAREHGEHIGKNNGNIAHQREHFELLSKDISDLIKTFGNGGTTLYKDFCPMYNKGAYWVSETKSISNPYFGKTMPSCGSVKEEIK